MNKSTRLEDIVGPRSWLIFELLDVKYEEIISILKQPVKDWTYFAIYLNLEMLISNIVVVNDPAERGVLLAKMIHNNITYNKSQKEYLVPTIETLRKIVNDTRRETVSQDVYEIVFKFKENNNK